MANMMILPFLKLAEVVLAKRAIVGMMNSASLVEFGSGIQWADIYSHAETSGARRGAFFRFSRPTLRQFSHLFVSDQFWHTAGAFSRTTIFFKLQAGMFLVSLS